MQLVVPQPCKAAECAGACGRAGDVCGACQLQQQEGLGCCCTGRQHIYKELQPTVALHDVHLRLTIVDCGCTLDSTQRCSPHGVDSGEDAFLVLCACICAGDRACHVCAFHSTSCAVRVPVCVGMMSTWRHIPSWLGICDHSMLSKLQPCRLQHHRVNTMFDCVAAQILQGHGVCNICYKHQCCQQGSTCKLLLKVVRHHDHVIT